MIERSSDYRRIKRFTEDYVISHEVLYLMERDETDLGVWTIHAWKDGAMMHANMGEGCRGKRARDSARDALRWVGENTDFTRVYVKTGVKAAQAMAAAVGFEFLYPDGNERVYAIEV